MRRPEDSLTRVLIADDSDIALARLENILRQDPSLHVVGRARNGSELLRLADQVTAEVILLDALMPEMTGLSALRRLTSSARVIVVSSEPDGSAIAREALAQGAESYFTKLTLGDEIGEQKLRTAVRRAAGHSDHPQHHHSPHPRPRSFGHDPVQVLIADDSDIAASRLENILKEDPGLRVVGRAHDGAELLALADGSDADVVLLDALMPEMTGLSALRHLVSRFRVIVVSSQPTDSAVAREVVAQGAHSFVSKADLGKRSGEDELRAAVHRAARSSDPSRPERVLLVAGSTGAIGPLSALLRDLRDLRIPILVVQHLPPGKDDALCQTLTLSGVVARRAQQKDFLEPGVFIAPVGKHLELGRAGQFRLADDPPINGHCPSADALFRSAVPIAHRVVALMLPGLGNDGAEAMAELAAAGATCLALDPADCRAPSMPQSALNASRLVKKVPAVELANKVRWCLRNGRR